MAPEITCNPDPAVQGANVTICLLNGTLPATLDLEWSPANAGPAQIELPSPSGCYTFSCPDNAVQLTISDPEEEAEYREIPVVPPT